ncbi:MAG: ABC transporter ATP-binding protein [Rhodospirillales bacterium]|nr:ABC transporter ATP-binding protein [Rhodospirillales bacterium]
MTGPTLNVRSLCINYGPSAHPLRAVRDVSFQIAPGEAYGLIGESGSGKSTIAFTIMRYLRGGHADGQVWLAGQDVMRLPEAALTQVRGRVAAMVYQDPMSALNPSMRVGEQVAEAVRLHRGADRAAAAARAVELFERVHLPTPSDIAQRYAHQLSGGQQQRVVIAMALACDPKLLIMDEPTTGLDVTTEAVILELVRELRRETGVSVLFISHNMGVIAQVCDRVGVLYAGQLVEEGRTVEVLHAPRHPYTIGLMRAMPQPGGAAHRLASIPGRLPDLQDPPPGCVFAARCEIATDLCGDVMPALLPASGREASHGSRCHYRDEAEALLPPPPLIAHGKASLGAGAPLLEAVGLEKRFGRRSWLRRAAPVRAVHDVTLEIPPGQTLAVVGESGSGKSTLARCVAGLIVPDEGYVRLEETRLAAQVGRRSRLQQRDVQFIFQNPDGALNPHWTVKQLLSRPVQLYTDLRGDAVRRRVVDLLEMVNLGERYLGRFPREMSGGEKQRIGIARAFAGNPRLVICDEPTSALDISVQASILNELIALQARHGTAYLFVSHDLGVVRHVAHRVAIMRHGRIVEAGDPAEVFERPHDPYTRALIDAIPTLVPPPAVAEARVTQIVR